MTGVHVFCSVPREVVREATGTNVPDQKKWHHKLSFPFFCYEVENQDFSIFIYFVAFLLLPVWDRGGWRGGAGGPFGPSCCIAVSVM